MTGFVLVTPAFKTSIVKPVRVLFVITYRSPSAKLAKESPSAGAALNAVGNVTALLPVKVMSCCVSVRSGMSISADNSLTAGVAEVERLVITTLNSIALADISATIKFCQSDHEGAPAGSSSVCRNSIDADVVSN